MRPYPKTALSTLSHRLFTYAPRYTTMEERRARALLWKVIRECFTRARAKIIRPCALRHFINGALLFRAPSISLSLPAETRQAREGNVLGISTPRFVSHESPQEETASSPSPRERVNRMNICEADAHSPDSQQVARYLSLPRAREQE